MKPPKVRVSRLFPVGVLVSAFMECAGPPAGPSQVPGAEARGALFSEDFESGTLAAWQDGVDPSRQRVVESESAQSGNRYLAVTYPTGADGGWLTRFFMPGFDSLYVSFYVRFPSNWQGGTKLVGLYGSRTDDQWSAFGKAGVCPNGTDFFDAMLVTEPSGDPGPLRFYTYYPGMAREPDSEVCWGRYGDRPGLAAYAASTSLSGNAWHHIEFLVQLNAPERADGHQVFWIDGAQGAAWSSLKLRTSSILRLNAVQLSFSSGAVGVPRAQELHIDNFVVRDSPP